MGMDVYGKQPTADEGKYFRNNAWWWRPLADYCVEVAPAITAACTHWQSNDADGLHFSVENVQEFIAFLRVCGGFEIS